MADFDRAYKFLCRAGAGCDYYDYPEDSDGTTNFGISLRWYRWNVDPGASPDFIRDMTEEAAKRLIKQHWWDGKLFYAIQSQEIADRYFALTFNIGTRNATRVLQRAINEVPDAPRHVVVDGRFVPQTVETVNLIYPPQLLSALRAEAWLYYQRIMERRPEMRVFAREWLRQTQA